MAKPLLAYRVHWGDPTKPEADGRYNTKPRILLSRDAALDHITEALQQLIDMDAGWGDSTAWADEALSALHDARHTAYVDGMTFIVDVTFRGFPWSATMRVTKRG